jgi:hypothetical protein
MHRPIAFSLSSFSGPTPFSPSAFTISVAPYLCSLSKTTTKISDPLLNVFTGLALIIHSENLSKSVEASSTVIQYVV